MTSKRKAIKKAFFDAAKAVNQIAKRYAQKRDEFEAASRYNVAAKAAYDALEDGGGFYENMISQNVNSRVPQSRKELVVTLRGVRYELNHSLKYLIENSEDRNVLKEEETQKEARRLLAEAMRYAFSPYLGPERNAKKTSTQAAPEAAPPPEPGAS